MASAHPAASAERRPLEEDEDDEEETTPELTAETGLSADVLAALQAHLAAKAQSSVDAEVNPLFGMSQFWYTPETSLGLLREALAHVEGQEDGVVAILSAPSVMVAAAELEGGAHLSKLRLLEFDERFGLKFPDLFHRYDYNEPTGAWRGWMAANCTRGETGPRCCVLRRGWG